MLTRLKCQFALAVAVLAIGVAPASAQDRLCDPGNEDCRAILINYIRSETVGIDVAFWFMEDARYTNELIARWRAGVPVRVLMDPPRQLVDYPLNAERLAELQSAGIPMRKRLTSYILHWKMMLFHGQNVVEFSGANYSAERLAAGNRRPVRELRRRRHLLHQRHGDRQQLPHPVRRPVGRHDRLGQLRQRRRRADAPLRNLPEGSVAELRAVGELPHARCQRLQRRALGDRRDHVSHHRSRACRRDDRGGARAVCRCG